MNNYWNQRRALVTGAGGFIGTYVVRELARLGASVTACVSDRRPTESYVKAFPQGTAIRHVDLLDPARCEDAVVAGSVIFNIAALDGGAAFKKTHAPEIYRTNTGIVSNLLEAGRRKGAEKILLMSSTDVYPDTLEGELTEDMPLPDNPDEGYVRSKRMTETTAAEFARENPHPVPVVVRMGNVYGPGDDPARGRVIPVFISRALSGSPIEIWGDRKVRRPFLFVRDCARILAAIVERATEFDVINVTGENDISLADLASRIVRLAGSSSAIRSTQEREPADRTISTAKLRTYAGDIERTPFDSGLTETIDYYRRSVS